MAEKILIVDDDLDTLRLVGLLLQRKGYQIVTTDNGSEALDKARSEQPDLILLDIMMPVIDGIEVLRRLRASKNTSGIPVIMFTAKSQVDDKVTGFEAGADDYLTKPTHPAELVARVRTILARSAARQSNSGNNRSPQDKGKVITIIGAKGGVGATTLAVNLGLALQAGAPKGTLLAELRPGMGSAGLMLHLPENDALCNLLRKSVGGIQDDDLKNAVFRHPSGLSVLASSINPSDARYLAAGDQMAEIVEKSAFQYSYVLTDPGPGLPPSSMKIIEKSDQILVVTEPAPTTIAQTKALLDELRMKVLGLGAIQLVLVYRVKLESQMATRDIQTELGHSLAAVIPPVPDLAYESLARATPIIVLKPDSVYSQQVNKLAEGILA